MLVAFIVVPIVDNSIYLYYTEDSPSTEFFDCINHQNLFYCRRPTGPISLQRNKISEQCYHNGTSHLFSSLLSNNITVSIVLHQWKSSIEKVEQYSRYIAQQIKSVDDDNKHLCQCHHPQSFGKNCEYFLPIDNNTFEATLNWEIQMRFLNREEMEKHGDVICYTTLNCNSGLLCLDWRDICDGIQQCMLGYDEENCDRLEFNECENNEYRCMNGMCIPDEYFLDGDYDCMDFSDEKHLFNDINCTFQQVNLDCDDRMCLPNKWSCGDGQCINNRLAFQQLFSVDRECTSRRDQFYMCETASYNRRWTLPNGRCDGSKEYEESNVQIPSKHQMCIYYLKCLLTYGAEKNCPCRYIGSCFDDADDWCDTIISFPDGNIIAPYATIIYKDLDDFYLQSPFVIELDATIKCRGFQVERHINLPFPSQLDLRDFEIQLCDNSSHDFVLLNGGYDLNCHNDSLTANNHFYHFIDICNSSKECISAYRINDGIRNCADGLDEEQSETVIEKTCSRLKRHRFRCSIDEPTCLSVNVLGDIKSDCKNKRDEMWMGTDIALSEMNCNRESKRDCQAIRQYIEASWYSDISEAESKRTSITKIPFRRFCDTFYDLESRRDEDANTCEKWWKCLDEQWQCRTGQCIDVKWVLDGEWDCSDASDEESLFASNHTILPRNLELISIDILTKKFNDMSSRQPFSDICNLSTEYPCFRADIHDPLVNITNNRPCINLEQIGDGHIDCIGGRDERNTIRHCTNPTTLGNDFMCISSGICLDEHKLCDSECPNPFDRHVLCRNHKESSVCFHDMNTLCVNGTCAYGKCDGRKNCLYREDEYMCSRVEEVHLDMVKTLYRKNKELKTRSNEHKFRLPRLPLHINYTMRTDLPILSVQNKTMNVRSLIPTNSSLPYVCNRGVGVLTHRGLMACFCPPQYYGIKCQFHNDRVTVILHLNLSQSIYAETSDPRLIIKLLILFLYENQTLNTHEFHVRPAMENIIYKKMIHHFLYSRSNKSLLNKQMRYFDRSNIIKHQPYAIRIEAYELNMAEKAQFIAIWQYPIYFDYLPSFRLSKVLKLMKLNDINNPCSNNPCAPSQKCHQLQNQRSTYICLCLDNLTGTNCSILNQMCADGFCSSYGLCKPTYTSLLSGNEIPYCICPLNTFGRQCNLIYDTCLENPCQNNGTCLNSEQPNEFQCVCDNRYYGKQCELEKLTVKLYFNGSVIHTGGVVQYFRLNFISLDLILVHQRVFISLPNVIFTVHGDDKAPEVILTKFYVNKKINIYLISLQINETSINETIQLTEKSQCMPVTTLWSTTEGIYGKKYSTTLCTFLFQIFFQSSIILFV
jgi:hypothetical protein